jgi:transposase-like protein
MRQKRRTFSPTDKAKIALESIKGVHTVNEIAQRFEVHPTQVNTWRRELIERLPELFGDKQSTVVAQDQGRLIDDLYKTIGQLMIERDWLKKKADQVS